ncbi:Detected protein of unknown function [Hibiscus syriacus]|uniref:Receptor-like serine/threonine-protein kinase n=1 Tax=Hibiscus syriacus TaxID=106335 RepID=A0A6A3ATC3_HIBSY|nr:Detected protein of unknown function [Hibiscus syriacus]
MSCFYLEFGTGTDTITPSKSIKDPEFIISRTGFFRLGFFSFANSSNRYAGILYNRIPVQTVVWVANRNNPLKDFSGILKLSDDGNLVVLNGKYDILWSSNVTNSVPDTTTVVLLDNGNLVLNNGENNGANLWESFEHPSNAFIETMKIGTDVKKGRKMQLQSWKSAYDPAVGNFSLSFEPFNVPELILRNNKQLYFRTGPWNNIIFVGLISTKSAYFDGFYVVADMQHKTIDGTLWDDGKEEWVNRDTVYRNACDLYGKCGAFGVCDSTKRPICSCLKGFEPKDVKEWRRGNWSSGCLRTTHLQCRRDDHSGGEVSRKMRFEAGDDESSGFSDRSSMIIGEAKITRGVDLYVRLPSPGLGRRQKTKLINSNSSSSYPLFDFEELATATSNFHDTKKLGQGGFGPVYRGTLEDGKEIAVKRLSKASGQGLEEFMNEVAVISKLQHRNLVRILGCCVEGEEKMLVYEYCLTKVWTLFSLPEFLEVMTQASTKRVIGTYGYMSPEYAMQGQISEKSDVFSFGVLLLEIVSGEKNTRFYNDHYHLSLLGYAWKLWKEGNIRGLVDEVVWDMDLDSRYEKEMWRCVHVGLLCVQELAKDRPTMSTVVSMLNNEISDLNTPKRPVFTQTSQNVEDRFSLNDVTLTDLDGR